MKNKQLMFRKKLRVFRKYSINDKVVFENSTGNITYGIITGFIKLVNDLGLNVYDIEGNDVYTIKSEQIIMIIN